MENGSTNSGGRLKGRPRIVVVGNGFAGFTCGGDPARTRQPEQTHAVEWEHRAG